MEICIYIMLFEFHYDYKIPTSGEYISDRRRTNPDLCAEGGVGLDIDRCITVLYVFGTTRNAGRKQ